MSDSQYVVTFSLEKLCEGQARQMEFPQSVAPFELAALLFVFQVLSFQPRFTRPIQLAFRIHFSQKNMTDIPLQKMRALLPKRSIR